MRSRFAGLVLAMLVSGPTARAAGPERATPPPPEAAAAPAPGPTPFELVPRRVQGPGSQRLAIYTALAGAVLVAASFPLSDEADRRYERYLAEVDLSRLDERFRAAERMDLYSATALIAGEALLATAVWLRFVHEPGRGRLALEVRPERCAVALRF